MGTNVLILAAGQSADVSGNNYPICLTEFDGVSLLERIIANVSGVQNARFTLAVLDKEARKYHLEKVAEILLPAIAIIRVPENTRGSACTALLAAAQMHQGNDLLIVGANEIVDTELSEVVNLFKLSKLDGGVVTFKSIHPRYSYVKINNQRLVIEAAALAPISQLATTGIFWFSQTSEFVMAAMEMIRKDAAVENTFYIAPVYNEMILLQKNVGIFEIEPSKYRPLKNERQIVRFETGVDR